MDDFVKAIKAELPNAIISWDISAWIGTAGFTQWFKFCFKYHNILFYFNDSRNNFLQYKGGAILKQLHILILFIQVEDK